MTAITKASDFAGSAFRLIAGLPGPEVVLADCYRVTAKAARNRNQLAVRARLAGDEKAARRHQHHADWYIARARMYRNDMEAKNG